VLVEADRCDRLGLIFYGKVLATGAPADIRRFGASDNLEQAFLTLASKEPVAKEALR
jgi:hypothetical protein